MLVSRFLLHLQSVKQHDVIYLDSSTSAGATSSTLQTLVFERIVGSIASTIHATNNLEEYNQHPCDHTAIVNNATQGPGSTGELVGECREILELHNLNH